jgi:biotin synthase
MTSFADSCGQAVEAGHLPGRDEALRLLADAERDPWPLWLAADRVRRRFRGPGVRLCSIAAVKLGRCGEDCRWCAQSAHWNTGIASHGMISADELVVAAKAAAAAGAGHFGLVTSGGTVSDAEIEALCATAVRIRAEAGLDVCGAFGALTPERARRLVQAGIVRYNHNIETSPRHFPSVCSTHTYEDRLRTARAAAAAGMELCSGALFGMGEADEDRVDVALAVRQLGSRVVPLNFLHPIPGTPLAGAEALSPRKILSIVAMFRLMLPDRILKMAGGREKNLRDLQCLMFLAGADSCMVGGYLTTSASARSVEVDMQMIRDLGLPIVPDDDAPAQRCSDAVSCTRDLTVAARETPTGDSRAS